MEKINMKKRSWPTKEGLKHYGITKEIAIFLEESNRIEREYSLEALDDAIKSWNYLKEKKVLTVENILEVHNILLKNINPRIAGKIRDCDIMIGGQRKFFISETLIKEDLEKLCNFINRTLEKNPKIKTEPYRDDLSKKSHVRFEDIHPFEDGNGRVGRLIYLWHRLQLGLPIKIIHADWDEKGHLGEQANYYKLFKKEN